MDPGEPIWPGQHPTPWPPAIHVLPLGPHWSIKPRPVHSLTHAHVPSFPHFPTWPAHPYSVPGTGGVGMNSDTGYRKPSTQWVPGPELASLGDEEAEKPLSSSSCQLPDWWGTVF